MPERRRVALVSLGCARNDVDSEELAGRLAADGWDVVGDPDSSDVVLVNTCGFIQAAKQESIDTLIAAADSRDADDSGPRAVVAVGCLAERYGRELAAALPEADAVLGFDDYQQISSRLDQVLAGESLTAHEPIDRRTLLPISPVERKPRGELRLDDEGLERAPASGPSQVRRRLDDSPVAPLKLASGCDRRCSFCAIPTFRGAFVSRRPTDVIAEASWLIDNGARELFLVSENSTSYGKDLADLGLLPVLLTDLAGSGRSGTRPDEGPRVRVSYLQPAELRDDLLTAICTTEGVAPYFDLSFQHASPSVLRRMRRFGGTADFLALIERIRALAPAAGIRSNFIVGFPGETEDDVAELIGFLESAGLDAVGVFGYSDEDGTEAAGFDGHVDADEIAARVSRVAAAADRATWARALDRIGESVRVLVVGYAEDDDSMAYGPADHQGPEDGVTYVRLPVGADAPPRIGEFVEAVVVDTAGVDLIAEVSSR